MHRELTDRVKSGEKEAEGILDSLNDQIKKIKVMEKEEEELEKKRLAE